VKQILLAVALALFWHVPSHAQVELRPVLEVSAAGAPASLADMERRIRALEARLGLSLRWQQSSAIDVREIVAQRTLVRGVVARVWLDLTDRERAVLFISNAGQDRLLVRVVPARGGYGELTQESLATIVESAVDALLAGGQIGVERAAAVQEIEAQTGTRVELAPEPSVLPAPVPPAARVVPPPAPSEPSETSAERALVSTLALAYRGDALGSRPDLRHGLALGLALTGFFEPRCDLLIGVSGLYFPPFELGEEGLRVREHGGGGRVSLGATGAWSQLFAWQVALSAGVDVARVEPNIAATTQLEAAPPFVVVAPLVGALAGVVLRPLPFLELMLGAGMELDLSGHHFDVQESSGQRRAVSLWRVRPLWLVGVGVPLTRAGRRRG
jgi:hypothetical protein